VYLADQAVGERQALLDASKAVLQRRDVVGHFDNVIERHPGGGSDLEQQQVGQRRLGSLDLRRDNGLLADIAVEEQLGIRQQRGDAVQAAQRQKGPVQLGPEC
jgi:hypothetical protein